MPYRLAKVDGYRVTGPSGVHAKRTSYQKAMAQMSLLRAREHSGWSPTGKKKARRYKKKTLIGR